MAKATKILDFKLVDSSEHITEVVIWRLPAKSKERPHGLKYSLYFGNEYGKSLVRYDNERGKGDHKHIGRREYSYLFVDIDTLIRDFQQDIADYWEKKDG